MFSLSFQVAILLYCIHSANMYKTCPNDCVLLRNCSEAVAMKSDSRMSDITWNNRMRSSTCKFKPRIGHYVCCSDFKVKNVKIEIRFPEMSESPPTFIVSTTASTTTSTSTTTTTTPSTTTEVSTTLPEHPNMRLLPDDCGEFNMNRIFGGEMAELYDYTWMVLIGYEKEGNYTSFQCAGTLINPKYVLTAAHCISDRINGLRVGEYNIGSDDDCHNSACDSGVQDLHIDKKIVHEKYEGHPYHRNDIALIRLKESVNMTFSNVGTICLPVTARLRETTLAGKQATVTGWGLTEYNTESSILRKVNVPILSDKECRNYYRVTSKEDILQICAGDFHRDSCRGDSGGPLFMTDVYRDSYSHSFIQYGIVSKGEHNCGNGVPALYTDVRQYIDWILDHLEE